jgi:NADPH:quinone reductase-like Zn-dependent oxidoreductase
MRAVVRNRYGPPDVLELAEIDKPEPGEDEILVRVRAASVNPADWYTLTGPLVARVASGLRKPKSNRLGTDYAGEVEAVGANVTEFRPGDEVFGGRTGALAEYVAARADRGVVAKPPSLTFEEAAAVPIAALTALQALRDKGHVQAGQRVLINGASGGVGTFAVQIAKVLDAEVTGVCSTGNVETARSLGADHVIDYTKDDFTRSDRRYDVIADVAGSKTWSELKRVLEPRGTVVIVGAPKGDGLLGPLGHIIKLRLASLRGSQKAVFFIAKINKADMEAMRELLESGGVKPVVDRRYGLDEVADAFRYLGEGHARGKVVVTVP